MFEFCDISLRIISSSFFMLWFSCVIQVTFFFSFLCDSLFIRPYYFLWSPNFGVILGFHRWNEFFRLLGYYTAYALLYRSFVTTQKKEEFTKFLNSYLSRRSQYVTVFNIRLKELSYLQRSVDEVSIQW
jgi:hypothetical protein